MNKKTADKWSFDKGLRAGFILFLIVIMSACGGGGNDAKPNPIPVITPPAISDVVPEKTKLTFNKTGNSSQELGVTIQFDNNSEEKRTLTVNWSSEDQKVTVEDSKGTQYRAEVIDSASNESEKALRVTEPESAKVFEISIAFISQLPPVEQALINKIELQASKPEMSIGESLTLGFIISYADNKSVTALPAGIACHLQQGEGVINVNSNCQVEALAAGSAKISLTAANGLLIENIRLPVIDITVLAPKVVVPRLVSIMLDSAVLTIQSDSSSQADFQLIRHYDIGADNSVALTIKWISDSRTFSAVDSNNLAYSTSFNTVNFESGSGVLTITQPETDLTVTVNVTIEFPAPVIERLRFDAVTKEILSGETSALTVYAVYTDGSEIPANSLVRCVEPSSGLISVTADCKFTGVFPGSYALDVELLNPALASADLQIDTLQVTVNPLLLGNFSTLNKFELNQNVGTSAVAFEVAGINKNEIYKVILGSTSAAGITENINFHVLAEMSIGKGCSNGSYPDKPSVACGVKATADSLYVFLETFDNSNLGQLNYQLSLLVDKNIVLRDGYKLRNDGKIEIYETLNVGTSFSGHVPANNYNTNNLSSYKTDTAHGMKVDGNDYEVAIMFKSPYFQQDSVAISYDSSDFSGNPVFIIDPQDCTVIENTITCKVPNGEKPQNIFVNVCGNGCSDSASPFSNSLTAVDGEVEYDIIITQP